MDVREYMILRRGDIENLTGNAVVYWDVIGSNSIAPDHDVFAINFVVSSLPLDKKLLTATFPPIPYKSHEDLFEKLATVYCDIIYGGLLEFPPDQETLNKFYKNEFEKYNKVIEEYVEAYKEKFNFLLERLSEIEKLKLLQKMVPKARVELNETVNEKKNDFTTKTMELIEDFQNDNKYDMYKLKELLFMPGKVGDLLVNLYIKKFLAIYNEEYENASRLKHKITKLQQEDNIENNGMFG